MADTKAGRSPTGASLGPAVPPHWQNVRVLLADDHRAYRLLIGAFLHTLGLAHEAVGDGRQALDALADRPFDLVISDCRMPVLDGYAMTRELRRREAQAGRVRIPVIALTACLGAEQVQRCMACGMDNWLVKPITLEQLRDVLRDSLPDPHRQAPLSARPTGSVLPRSRLPTRASLIATFGTWEVVEPLLFCMIQEAHDDLAALEHAGNTADAAVTAQLLHRLRGSIAFFGTTDLEPRTLQLIDQLCDAGVQVNRAALKRFHREVEGYLQYLANL